MAYTPLYCWLDGRGDDNGGKHDEDYVAQIPQDIEQDKYQNTLEDSARRDSDGAVVHSAIITQKIVKSTKAAARLLTFSKIKI